jgi:hypothetical protein
MNEYARFVEWLKRNSNQGDGCYNVWPLEDMAQESGIPTNRIENYLEILEEQDDTFSYWLFTEGFGGRGCDMCEWEFEKMIIIDGITYELVCNEDVFDGLAMSNLLKPLQAQRYFDKYVYRTKGNVAMACYADDVNNNWRI